MAKPRGAGMALISGLASGAAGSAALNIATYLDIAARGRPPSGVPAKDVEALADRTGVELGAPEAKAQHRRSALGALMGYASGLSVAVGYALVRSRVRKLPLPLAAVVVGGAAMAGTDVTSTALGTTNPAKWSAKSWAADVLPHLAYGAVTVVSYEALER